MRNLSTKTINMNKDINKLNKTYWSLCVECNKQKEPSFFS